MSNPLLDLSIAVTIASVAVLSAIVLPRPKPEPPAPVVQSVCDPQKEECRLGSVTIRVEPKTDDERLDDVRKKADEVSAQQRKLIEQVKQLTLEVRKK